MQNEDIIVGDGQSCKPFVSVYTDCTEENKCTGCHKCSCSADGVWECQAVTMPCGEDDELDDDHKEIDDSLLDDALNEMLSEFKGSEVEQYKEQRAPPPRASMKSSPLIAQGKQADIRKPPSWDEISKDLSSDDLPDFMKMFRRKRSAEETEEEDTSGNKTVIFHHAVDEVNEDTLKNSNASGTIPAAKLDLIPVASRRSTPLKNSSTPLQIQYTSPIQRSHAADNKVDAADIHDDQVDLLVHHKIYEIVGNKSQESRDKDLSKIVVNELKGGQSEVIGDKNSPVISNITFTSDNDTLTAMAFIAGNLLNKLWNMEKESEDSLETEHMKHKKINDLLDLFKEPLNLRQELFLKNALQHLSTAIETKNIGNVTLCENIEQLKHKSGIADEINEPQAPTKSQCKLDPETISSEIIKPEIDRATSAAAALQKITTILDLIQKYEKTQIMIKDIKNKSKFSEKATDSDFSEDEHTTLNVFGNIIESLTKLIIPNKKSKKITNGIKNKNFLVGDEDVKNRFKNLNLTNMNLTTKDKMVLDYIKHIQNNPNCLLNKKEEKPIVPNIEGDILLNVAEFFKIKSMSDLLKVVNTDSNKGEIVMRSVTTSTETSTAEQHFTKKTTTSTPKPTTSTESNLSKFENTKEKLKSHLKTILEDLVELQNVTGNNKDGKTINIADALPCIYNLLNNRESNSNSLIKAEENIKKDKNPIAKITRVLNNLKKELNSTMQTRRTNIDYDLRPKSAVVWERTIKNIGNKLKATRRCLKSESPKTIENVKTKIDKMENSGSNTYKSVAFLTEIPAAERLLLLKTLAKDTKKYISLLNDINEFVENKKDMALEDYKTFSEFVENANININVNGKVIAKISKPKTNVNVNQDKRFRVVEKASSEADLVTDKEMVRSGSTSSTVKLTRDQIINQLIRNRMLYFLKLKAGAMDRKSIANAKLARKIIFYLEMGSDNLARDLFRVFVLQNKNNMSTSTPINKIVETAEFVPRRQVIERRKIPQIPVPLIQFENNKQSDREPWLNQEQLLKQLMNIKNMK